MRLFLTALFTLALFNQYALAQTDLHISCDDSSRTIDCIAIVPADASPYDIERLADQALIKIADHFRVRADRDVILTLLPDERLDDTTIIAGRATMKAGEGKSVAAIPTAEEIDEWNGSRSTEQPVLERPTTAYVARAVDALLVFERISLERYNDDLSFNARAQLTAEELGIPLEEFTGIYRFMKNYYSMMMWG